MKYLSICSGIEAASVAFHELGWTPLAFSEIEAFPRAVLAHHYPNVPLHGDFTRLRDEAWIVDADLLVGGTPCQDFSIAGLRQSLSGDRGNLTLEYIRLADAIDDLRRDAGYPPLFCLWENVPGVLSTHDNAFGAVLAGLCGCDTALVSPRGYGWSDAGVVAGPKRWAAWRILDAQYYGLAQRRRRVFVLSVGGAGAWRCADALLPIVESMRWNPAPRREAREGVAHSITTRTGNGSRPAGGNGNLVAAAIAPTLRAGGNETGGDRPYGMGVDTCDSLVAMTLNAKGGVGRLDYESETLITRHGGVFDDDIAHALRAEGFDASEDGTGRGTPLVPVAFSCKDYGNDAQDDLSPTLRSMNFDASHANAGGQVAIAFDTTQITQKENRCQPKEGDPCHPLSAHAHAHAPALAFHARQDPDSGPVTHPLDTDGFSIGVQRGWQVRRLTPEECEKLQGFPPGYTAIPYRGKLAADGPRYRALGNSMAVNVMRWIGERIDVIARKPA